MLISHSHVVGSTHHNDIATAGTSTWQENSQEVEKKEVVYGSPKLLQQRSYKLLFKIRTKSVLLKETREDERKVKDRALRKRHFTYPVLYTCLGSIIANIKYRLIAYS